MPPLQPPSARRRPVRWSLLLGISLVACSPSPVVKVPATQVEVAPTILDIDRGRLLYDAHCIACHDRQVHWRDHSIIGSWSDLVVQVDRWQTNAGQHWLPSETGDVAAYLNSLYYRMPCPHIGCRGASATRDAPASFASWDVLQTPMDWSPWRDPDSAWASWGGIR